MKIAILRETKTPVDRRTPLTPLQCRQLLDSYSELEMVIQSDPNRCYSDEEYISHGIKISENINDCNVLMGVKEVKPQYLVDGKTYLFFSHTAKKQKYNLELLRTVIRKKIKLVDYEYLTDNNKVRIVAFGRWAGIVGTFNTLRAYGGRSGIFDLKPAWKCRDLEELIKELSKVKISNQKVVITGGGRVAGGALEILEAAGIKKVEPEDFLVSQEGNIFTQLNPVNYVVHREKKEFVLEHFFANPSEYKNNFIPYTRAADIFVACHFWDPRSPVLMTQKDMQDPGFRIKIIGDVSCDINGPIPSTIRASAISDPFYGFDVHSGKEKAAFDPAVVTVMAVDNLPGELPRDSSEDFGTRLVSEVIPALIGVKDALIIEKASIADRGRLTGNFSYLQDFLEGKE